jgi:hypothetical protein
LSEDKVQACLGTSITDKTVVSTSSSSPVGDLVLRQDVFAGSKSELSAADGENNVLEARVAASRNDDQAGSRVSVVAFDVLVQGIKGACLEINEGGSGIDNTRKAAARNGGGTVGDLGDVNTPVILCRESRLGVQVIKWLFITRVTYAGRRSACNGSIGDGSSILGRVSTTEGKLTIVGGGGTAADGLKVHTQNLGADQTLRVSVVDDGGNSSGTAYSSFCEIHWSETFGTLLARIPNMYCTCTHATHQ